MWGFDFSFDGCLFGEIKLPGPSRPRPMRRSIERTAMDEGGVEKYALYQVWALWAALCG